MKILIHNFWNGNITLWKSYWIVGELLNALIILIIFLVEVRIFNNSSIGNLLPFLSFNNFTLLNILDISFGHNLPKRLYKN